MTYSLKTFYVFSPIFISMHGILFILWQFCHVTFSKNRKLLKRLYSVKYVLFLLENCFILLNCVYFLFISITGLQKLGARSGSGA